MNFPAVPADPIAAVSHADPYPYYAQLRAGPPLAWDEHLRLWVASRAEVVMQLLAHPGLRVRPPAEPVPRAIAGTPAGELFSHLVRMNDGPLHATHRPVLQRALAGLDLGAAHSQALQVAKRLQGTQSLDDWCLALPVSAVAALLGFNAAQWPALARWTRDFVACLSPLSTEAQLGAASSAARELLQRFEALLAAPRPGSLLAAVCAEARQAGAGVERRVLLSNLVGLLSQTCESSAGLLGNAIVALAREPGLHAAWAAGDATAADIVAEVARHDPPVQNTRRFVPGQAVNVADTPLAAGDAILLVLGAAHRDPALNPAPDRFDLARGERRLLLGFGHGPHACPGQALAQAIAAAGLASLPRCFELPVQWHYRRSVNGRMPVFTPQER